MITAMHIAIGIAIGALLGWWASRREVADAHDALWRASVHAGAREQRIRDLEAHLEKVTRSYWRAKDKPRAS